VCNLVLARYPNHKRYGVVGEIHEVVFVKVGGSPSRCAICPALTEVPCKSMKSDTDGHLSLIQMLHVNGNFLASVVS